MKKKAFAIIVSLVVLLGAGLAVYASVNKDSGANSSRGGSPTKTVDDRKVKEKQAKKNKAANQKKAVAQKKKAVVKKSKKHSAQKKNNAKKTKRKTKKQKKSKSATRTKKTNKAVTRNSSARRHFRKGTTHKVRKNAPKQSQKQSQKRTNRNTNGTTTVNRKGHSKSNPSNKAKHHSQANKKANTTKPKQVQNGVKISIYGPIKEGNKAFVYKDNVAVHSGETVITVLKRDLDRRKMSLSYSGSGSTVYVKGINNLFEFDRGPESGWLYKVNGKFPGFSCGSYKVKSGDAIEWLYTENLGNDRGTKVKG